MNTAPIPVTLLGTNTVLTERLTRHPEFTPVDLDASGLVVYLPESGAVTDAIDTVTQLLGAGHDVVTTTPLDYDAIAAACRTGRSTFHATGGLPTAVVARFCRAFAGAWRDITHVSMTEFRDPDARFVPDADYEAGLRALAAAVLPELPDAGAPVVSSSHHADEIHVSRKLGPHVSYDSVWADLGPGEALRYRLTTTTAASGTGHTTLRFDTGAGPDIVDHLVAVGVLAAIRATNDSPPGILRHDFDIDHVVTDDRLPGSAPNR
ncbi:hypothetical protein [Nocardia alba]|uniref:Dihydrodipicolinate reductase n=1 Tax=Nocardia alba TaxID=225051 RepID=A0A4R1FNG9_9NOCA|nr:hypothetical protein [Nocardia alba]TCJ94934.1 hypothetical protein DFR71_3843 [Nocardia alba]